MNTEMHILYVEDEARSRKVMQMMASFNGFTNLVIFEDSTDFTERLLALVPSPEIIFLDIHMQPYNGFEMLAQLRQLPQFRHIPVIAMTASVMNEEIQQLRSASFDGCVAKPIDIETFPETLNRIVSGEKIWRIN
ncbi:MAG TPA: response regulator [Phototrophicaceae bacterium]|nr:response regulator [Phototrophicaceae bacterium]